ncbi:hypothetical protein J3459_017365 [Metarhizium acridum]|uniref:Uncharacterized protein n=1 Tax=Metarhizium acridum (strain CQMa 102) TaxID=655827 RepID=E9EGQ6_METAQ|nr:uncharacterized protein MAC_09054 [Metarhizium acridum CQMa 102]EFY84912.1 hypothetical protein MAC_09054 [Metarhizium acridum CQMa 102]KAG8409538.1 hypothetical protein J3459_017365 [Metarhizium acridum]
MAEPPKPSPSKGRTETWEELCKDMNLAKAKLDRALKEKEEAEAHLKRFEKEYRKKTDEEKKEYGRVVEMARAAHEASRREHEVLSSEIASLEKKMNACDHEICTVPLESDDISD